jgi:hypothetical protein
MTSAETKGIMRLAKICPERASVAIATDCEHVRIGARSTAGWMTGKFEAYIPPWREM